MAEITGFTGKRHSPRVDMTAMVDMAFLLLTFFVLTAVMTPSKMMKLSMPPKGAGDGVVKEERVMTLCLSAQNSIESYVGNDSLHKHRLSSNELRSEIKKHLTSRSPLCISDDIKDCWDPIFIIKPKGDAEYGTLVDVLDELEILNARKYMIDNK